MKDAHQHDTYEGGNNDASSMALLGMGSEACCNVADFFSILRDWELAESEAGGVVNGQ
jgi:hypothetical protein